MSFNLKKCSVSSPVITLIIVAVLAIACTMCSVLERSYHPDYPDYLLLGEYEDGDYDTDNIDDGDNRRVGHIFPAPVLRLHGHW